MEPPTGEECGDGCGGSNQCELCKDSLKWAARSAAVAVAAEDETTSAAAFPATLRLTTQRPLDGEGGKKKNLVYNTHDDDDDYIVVIIMHTKLTMMMMMMIVTLSFLCEEVDTSESCWGKNCPIVFVLPDF